MFALVNDSTQLQYKYSAINAEMPMVSRLALDDEHAVNILTPAVTLWSIYHSAPMALNLKSGEIALNVTEL